MKVENRPTAYEVWHNTQCEHCGADLMELRSIHVDLSDGDKVYDTVHSHVNADGQLADPTDDEAINEQGHHAGSRCVNCEELLEELQPPTPEAENAMSQANHHPESPGPQDEAPEPRKVEFFRLLEDHTWDTFVETLPPVGEFTSDDPTWDDVCQDDFNRFMDQFIHEKLIGQCQHRKAVMMGVYNSDPEQE